MSFEVVEHEGRTIGHGCSVGNAYFFFGLAGVDSNVLRARWPNFEFARIAQVHGRTVVAAGGDDVPEADGHETARAGVAPVVVTADCTPVLLASNARVAALHAGWRGVEANIVGAARERFDDAVLVAAIGPHLARASFEIGRDVAARLTSVAPAGVDRLEFPHADPNKVYFDLGALVRAQLRAAYGHALRILEFTPDTLTSHEYHSYRREGAGRGRNLSFVVRPAR